MRQWLFPFSFATLCVSLFQAIRWNQEKRKQQKIYIYVSLENLWWRVAPHHTRSVLYIFMVIFSLLQFQHFLRRRRAIIQKNLCVYVCMFVCVAKMGIVYVIVCVCVSVCLTLFLWESDRIIYRFTHPHRQTQVHQQYISHVWSGCAHQIISFSLPQKILLSSIFAQTSIFSFLEVK